MTLGDGGDMAIEALSPQDVGGGNGIVELPETTFDDAGRIRRLADGSVVGAAYFGGRAILSLVPLEYTANEAVSHRRVLDTLGSLSLADHNEVNLGDLN